MQLPTLRQINLLGGEDPVDTRPTECKLCGNRLKRCGHKELRLREWLDRSAVRYVKRYVWIEFPYHAACWKDLPAIARKVERRFRRAD